MSDVRVAVITAAGSGMGAEVRALWPRTGMRLRSSPRPARVKHSPANWVASESPGRTNLPMTSNGLSKRRSTDGAASTLWSTAQAMARRARSWR